jgi:hypothetical protein
MSIHMESKLKKTYIENDFSKLTIESQQLQETERKVYEANLYLLCLLLG